MTGRDWNPGDEAMWDWSADANQCWWLDAVRGRVRTPIFEAFSNSPPWFMTVSGRVSGAEKGSDDNLQPGREAVVGRQAVVHRDHHGSADLGQDRAEGVAGVEVADHAAAHVGVDQHRRGCRQI